MEFTEALLNELMVSFGIVLFLVAGLNFFVGRRFWGDLYFTSPSLDKRFSENYLIAESGEMAAIYLFSGFGLLVVLILAILVA